MYNNKFIIGSTQKYLLGVLCKVLALLLFCLLSLGFERLKTSNLTSTAQFGIVCFIGSILLSPFIFIKYLKEAKKAELKLYPLRAIVSIIAMVSWIEAVKHLGSNESVLVNYLAPIFTIIIASFTKDEKLKLVGIGSGIICYIIIFYTLKATIQFATYGFVMALISAFCYSAYEVICKKQSNKEHFLVQVFYTFMLAALFLLPFYAKNILMLTQQDLMALTIISLLRIGTIILLFLAIKFASLNYLTPVSYVKFPLMVALGFLFYGRTADLIYWIAAALLILVNIFVVMLQKKSKSS